MSSAGEEKRAEGAVADAAVVAAQQAQNAAAQANEQAQVAAANAQAVAAERTAQLEEKTAGAVAEVKDDFAWLKAQNEETKTGLAGLSSTLGTVLERQQRTEEAIGGIVALLTPKPSPQAEPAKAEPAAAQKAQEKEGDQKAAVTGRRRHRSI